MESDPIGIHETIKFIRSTRRHDSRYTEEWIDTVESWSEIRIKIVSIGDIRWLRRLKEVPTATSTRGFSSIMRHFDDDDVCDTTDRV